MFSVGLHGFPEVVTKMDRDFNYCISLRTCSPALLIMVECPLQDPYLGDAVQAAAADPGFGVTTCHFSDQSGAMSQTIVTIR